MRMDLMPAWPEADANWALARLLEIAIFGDRPSGMEDLQAPEASMFVCPE